MDDVLLSIDVGSGSLRCALTTTDGKILAQQKHPIRCWKPAGKMAFSSDDIWSGLVDTIKNLISLSSYEPDCLKGIGLDANASMLFLTADMKPIALPDNPECDIYGWMDHRALPQSEQFSSVMQRSGSNQRMIPETNIARALWLKQTHPELWKQCYCIIDLSDYLVWKLTDMLTYTNSSLSRRFDDQLIEALDFVDVKERLHGIHLPIGNAVGEGLSKAAAKSLKLPAGIPVASAITDGYGGTLATVMSRHINEPVNTSDVALKRLSMIVGTSTIYIATSLRPVNIFGTWGPTPSVLQGLYHNTVGQSAAGILLDYILVNHPASDLASNRARQKGLRITEYLNARLEELAGEEPVACLTTNLHMLPYFAGNRTPRMNMTLTGMISGLVLDNSEENLALHYLCAIQALALGARHNIETLISAGYEFDLLTPAGGLAKNPLFLAEHCNASGLPAAIPEQPDAMLLSGAMTAGLAAGLYPDWVSAIQSVSRYEEIINPDPDLTDYYERKYCVFLEMYEDQMKYRKVMSGEGY
ncbi:hypothetical protein GZ77_20210 [Endozoicomonas montiporae]|uniref:Carbohydrate kinase n=2 Tax=Endozoicomonas montiporae TaxID=1027273 RepID=A0A081N2W6_9GAMM|nr:FGGY-family carbohydrate kinase [Endozoicomonas montiporae]AMO58059.1 carbohydrate kinase [Endozoicomonas montiporae CL-33]KEQ12789.1 hypothetical protein GZ77_20210 [Endozoicomonas montiporae]